jgi:hypothetical protein
MSNKENSMYFVIKYLFLVVAIAGTTLVHCSNSNFINYTHADVTVQVTVSAKPLTVAAQIDQIFGQGIVSICLDTNQIILTRNGETFPVAAIAVPLETYNAIINEVKSTGKTTVDLNKFVVRSRNSLKCTDESYAIVVDAEDALRVIVPLNRK